MTRHVLIASALMIATTLVFARCPHAEEPNSTQLETPRCARVPVARDWIFVAFFDQYSDQINVRSRERLADMASLFVRHHISALQINAFTDSSEAGDGDLGARRARMVRAFFAHAGIPSQIISIHDFGATRPLVPTPPGVPEPQKRRLEFVPELHSTDAELTDRRDCEEWLRQHAGECAATLRHDGSVQACELTKHALRFWYFPD